LPKESSMRTMGCCANTTPAMAVADGCVCMARRTAAAGCTDTTVDVAAINPALVNWRVMLVATLWERFVNVATPPEAVTARVHCRVPLPAKRAAVMTLELSVVRRFPNESSMRMTGCCAKATPAVFSVEG